MFTRRPHPLTRLWPLALLAGSAVAAPSATQTVTFSIGNIKLLGLSATNVAFAFVPADWTPGSALSAVKQANAGTLAYTTNTLARVTVAINALPAQISSLQVQVGGGAFATITTTGAANVLTNLAPGAAGNLAVVWQAQANLNGVLTGATSTATFTIVDN